MQNVGSDEKPYQLAFQYKAVNTYVLHSIVNTLPMGLRWF